MEYLKEKSAPKSFRAAVASYEGILVDQHLGLADSLLIFEVRNEGCFFIEQRLTPPRGGGDERWQLLADILSDCTCLLTCSAGQRPQEFLSSKGIRVYQVEGLIEDVLYNLYKGIKMSAATGVPGCRCEKSGKSSQDCG